MSTRNAPPFFTNGQFLSFSILSPHTVVQLFHVGRRTVSEWRNKTISKMDVNCSKEIVFVTTAGESPKNLFWCIAMPFQNDTNHLEWSSTPQRTCGCIDAFVVMFVSYRTVFECQVTVLFWIWMLNLHIFDSLFHFFWVYHIPCGCWKEIFGVGQ